MFLDSLDEFQALSKDEKCANPSLERMKTLILDKFRREPESSGMFMVQKQIYTMAIKVCLKYMVQLSYKLINFK